MAKIDTLSEGMADSAHGGAANDADIDLAKPVDLVVVAVKELAARCRLIGSERVITLRAGSLLGEVPGQIVTVQPKKYWHFNGHP